jgi:hypothetical protein
MVETGTAIGALDLPKRSFVQAQVTGSYAPGSTSMPPRSVRRLPVLALQWQTTAFGPAVGGSQEIIKVGVTLANVLVLALLLIQSNSIGASLRRRTVGWG